jgi:hypothetical protein
MDAVEFIEHVKALKNTGEEDIVVARGATTPSRGGREMIRHVDCSPSTACRTTSPPSLRTE